MQLSQRECIIYEVARVNRKYDRVGFDSQNSVALVGSILGCIFGENSQ